MGKQGGAGHSSRCHVVIRKFEIAENQGSVETFLELTASTSTLSALVERGLPPQGSHLAGADALVRGLGHTHHSITLALSVLPERCLRHQESVLLPRGQLHRRSSCFRRSFHLDCFPRTLLTEAWTKLVKAKISPHHFHVAAAGGLLRRLARSRLGLLGAVLLLLGDHAAGGAVLLPVTLLSPSGSQVYRPILSTPIQRGVETLGSSCQTSCSSAQQVLGGACSC